MRKLQRIRAAFPDSNIDAFDDIGQDELMTLQIEHVNQAEKFAVEREALRAELVSVRSAAFFECICDCCSGSCALVCFSSVL